jgi:hypothetical protein
MNPQSLAISHHVVRSFQVMMLARGDVIENQRCNESLVEPINMVIPSDHNRQGSNDLPQLPSRRTEHSAFIAGEDPRSLAGSLVRIAAVQRWIALTDYEPFVDAETKQSSRLM